MAEQHGKALVPEIRFSGFTDPWEQRKLGELCSFSKGCGYSKNNLRDQGTPIILYGRLYTNYETQIHSVDTFVDPLENSVYTEGGEVIVPASGETAEDISIASVVEKPGIILGGDLNIITPSAVVNPVFLALELSYGKPHFDLAKRAQGKSVVHIHNEDIANVFFDRPCIAEQRRIGGFFDRLDSLITLHQRKYDKLCVLKKSMLDKMFPKGGSLYPEIRFSGFTDPWEQRKLSELVEIERGGSPRPIERYITDDPCGLNWVKIGDAPELGRYITQTTEKIKPEGLAKTRQVYPGDLVLSNSMSFGRPYIMAIKGCIHDGWLLIRDAQKHFDPIFLCHMLGAPQMLNQYRMFAAGSTVNNLNKELVGKAIVSLPSKDEQREIGIVLDRLDSLITLHQRKLELLRNIKKSMLDKMFV